MSSASAAPGASAASTTDATPVPPETLVEFLRKMLLIREFEERRLDLGRSGRIRASVHSYTGMEAIAVGAIGALKQGELVTSTHRPDGHALALGMDPRRVMAENMGKSTGYCGGKGGEKALAHPAMGFLGADTIVGGSLAIAVGAALGTRIKGRPQAVLCFFGDGAANAGAFHEACNLAGILSAAVVFICENNQYALSKPSEDAIAGGSVAARAAGYGFPGVTVDGQDVLAVHAAVATALQRARSGAGPSLIECKTYRFEAHASGRMVDARPADQVAVWKQTRDPISIHERRLLEHRVVTVDEVAQMRAEVVERVGDAVRFALDSPIPDEAEALKDVYA